MTSIEPLDIDKWFTRLAEIYDAAAPSAEATDRTANNDEVPNTQ